jgi:acetyl esterase
VIDPSVQRLLDAAAQRGAPPTHALPVEEARRLSRERRPATQPDAPAVAEVQDIAGPVALRLYRPQGGASGGTLPALVYFHGGGWMMGDLDSHDVLCRELCNGSGCAVVAVDYRLSPEHCFPAALDDAVAAVRWVHANGAALRIDASRLAVGGDSAGANLATVAAITGRDTGGPPLAFQLLIYPVTEVEATLPSHVSNGEGYMITAETLRYFMRLYLGDSGASGWRVSPLHAPDLGGLPPALVITAGFDPLRDEGTAYADRLAAAGNPVSHVCFERQIHGFITMGRVIPEARTAVALCAAELRRALHAAG